MKGVLVPLPAPGAPPSQMISPGKQSLARPNSCSRSLQTRSKIRLASLISRSMCLDLDFAMRFCSRVLQAAEWFLIDQFFYDLPADQVLLDDAL